MLIDLVKCMLSKYSSFACVFTHMHACTHTHTHKCTHHHHPRHTHAHTHTHMHTYMHRCTHTDAQDISLHYGVAVCQ